MLFSEPKIPQCGGAAAGDAHRTSFSALQRAENSSIPTPRIHETSEDNVSVLFSEPKIPQSQLTIVVVGFGFRFSALQRAENSSIDLAALRGAVLICFSALQRAENSSMRRRRLCIDQIDGFSALQRAENSSIQADRQRERIALPVSVLFSEPKIPQCVWIATR